MAFQNLKFASLPPDLQPHGVPRTERVMRDVSATFQLNFVTAKQSPEDISTFLKRWD
jgi:hypothetical protein